MTTVSLTMVITYNALITFAGDIRNDLYVTLEKGEFEKGKLWDLALVLFHDTIYMYFGTI